MKFKLRTRARPHRRYTRYDADYCQVPAAITMRVRAYGAAAANLL